MSSAQCQNSAHLPSDWSRSIATHSSILAWRIPWTDHGVAKSWTWLSDQHSTQTFDQAQPIKFFPNVGTRREDISSIGWQALRQTCTGNGYLSGYMGKLVWKWTQDTGINETTRFKGRLHDVLRVPSSRYSPWISQWCRLIFFQKTVWVKFLLHAVERVLIKSLRKLSSWWSIISLPEVFLFDICQTKQKVY